MQRPLVVPANAVVDVQLRSNLPGILGEEVPRIHEDLAVGVAKRNAGLVHAPGQKVGQRINVGVARIPSITGRGFGTVGPLRAVEREAAQRVTLVELIELRLAKLAAE